MEIISTRSAKEFSWKFWIFLWRRTQLPDADFQNCLTTSDIFGVFIDNVLVSCAGFYSLSSAKTKHRGVIWGLYTQLECRGQGIGSALIQTVINHAKSRVIQLHLTCVTSNHSAVAFYQTRVQNLWHRTLCTQNWGYIFWWAFNDIFYECRKQNRAELQIGSLSLCS